MEFFHLLVLKLRTLNPALNHLNATLDIFKVLLLVDFRRMLRDVSNSGVFGWDKLCVLYP